MSILSYSVGEHHDEFSRFFFPAKQSVYHRQWSLVATDLAEDFFHNHDGWESHWPLEFRLYEDDIEVARFSIDQDAEPVFYAHDIEIEADGEPA